MENKEEKVTIQTAVILVCRKCKTELKWGQRECQKCKTSVICGLPNWIDFPIYPRRARLKLVLQDDLIKLYGENELPFCFVATVNEWKNAKLDPLVSEFVFSKHLDPLDEARLLAYLPLDISTRRLIEMSEHKNSLVRETVVRSMGRLKSEKFTVRLKEMETNERDADVRKAVKKALTTLG